jgi:hypothetical protein
MEGRLPSALPSLLDVLALALRSSRSSPSRYACSVHPFHTGHCAVLTTRASGEGSATGVCRPSPAASPPPLPATSPYSRPIETSSGNSIAEYERQRPRRARGSTARARVPTRVTVNASCTSVASDPAVGASLSQRSSIWLSFSAIASVCDALCARCTSAGRRPARMMQITLVRYFPNAFSGGAERLRRAWSTAAHAPTAPIVEKLLV